MAQAGATWPADRAFPLLGDVWQEWRCFGSHPKQSYFLGMAAFPGALLAPAPIRTAIPHFGQGSTCIYRGTQAIKSFA